MFIVIQNHKWRSWLFNHKHYWKEQAHLCLETWKATLSTDIRSIIHLKQWTLNCLSGNCSPFSLKVWLERGISIYAMTNITIDHKNLFHQMIRLLYLCTRNPEICGGMPVSFLKSQSWWLASRPQRKFTVLDSPPMLVIKVQVQMQLHKYTYRLV